MVGGKAAGGEWLGEGAPGSSIGPEWNPAVIGWRRGCWAAIGGKGELREPQPIAARRGRALIQWRSGAAPGPRLALSPLPSSSGSAANRRAARGGRGWRRRRAALPLAARGARSDLNRRRRAGGERAEGGGAEGPRGNGRSPRAWGRTRLMAALRSGMSPVCAVTAPREAAALRVRSVRLSQRWERLRVGLRRLPALTG